MRALILGLGISGQSAAKLLKKKGYDALGVDKERENEPFDLNRFDLVVVSPGVPPGNPLYRRAREAKREIISEAELGLREAHCPVVGVTGTNGKTTVTSLITHVLQKEGIRAKAMGNIGLPLSSIEGNEEIIVAELSSFQLEQMHRRLLDLGIVLNITPDHLDRYDGDFENYLRAKLKIQDVLKEEAPLLIESKHANLVSHRPLYPFKGGNEEAALFACRYFGVTEENFFSAAKTFLKPRHRLQWLGKIEGVNYWDDSKGTNVDAVVHAVNSLNGKVILIAGGVHKGASYEPWLTPFKNKVKRLCLIGESANAIAEALSSLIPNEIFVSLAEAVKSARSHALAGEHVLLSPGCASFDMFENYKERGRAFQEIVRELR